MAENRPQILVVDDDRLMVAMMSDVFAGRFTVLTALSGEEALKKARGEELTAVLSDHIMPGVTGVEVLRECITLQPLAVRILVTASESVNDIREAINGARVHRVVAKPIHPVELEGIVDGAIHERDLERENERLVRELRAALAEVQARERELERELQVRTDELRDVMHRLLHPAQ